MIRKTWLEAFGRAALLVFFLLFTPTFLANVAHAQSAQAPTAAPVVRPSSPPAFLVAPSVSLGYSPASIASGALTSSGRIDLVTADSTAGKITVFTGLGHGTFASGTSYAAGAQPTSLVIADIDGDGKADVVLANPSDGVISVFPGNGDGTLGARKTVAIGFAPSMVAAGDFTGNGKLDLAVAGASTRSLAILQNDGAGNLKRPLNYALRSAPGAIVTADFNGDSHPDLAIANVGGTVSVFLGMGNGQFSSLPDISVASGDLASIAAGDFNRDGITDLVITSTALNQAAILLGHGDGQFAPATFLPVGDAPVATYVGDVDGDGVSDLIVVNRGNNTFSVLSGVGDGTFKTGAQFVVGNAPLAAVPADFYGNGRVDLATINQLGETMSVPANNGDGTFAAGRAYVAGVQPVAVASGDLTKSGRSDLVVASYCGADATCGGSGSAAVLLAGPGGGYQLSSTYAMGAGTVAVHLIDVNGDGKLDMLALNRIDKALSIRLGTGDGTFGGLISIPLSAAPIALATADFTKDGKTDLAVLGDCGSVSCSQPGTVEFLRGSGDGNFQSMSNYPAGYAPVALAAGKITASGNSDVVVANRCGTDASCKSGGTATLLFGNGAGTFKPGMDVALGNNPSSIALANLRGVGVLDLVVSRSTEDSIAVLTGTGDGSFGAAMPYAVGHAPGTLVIADFNGDGQPDVAVANTADSSVSVLFGSTGGKLQTAFAVPVAGNPYSLAALGSSTGRPGLTTPGGSIATPTAASSVTVVSNLNPRPAASASGGTTVSSTALTSGTNPSLVNQSVLLTATVTGQAGSGNPSGSVVFESDGTALADCGGAAGRLTTPDAGVNSIATCTISSLTASSGPGHALTANYLGDTVYDISNSSVLNQVVNTATTTLTIAGPSSASAVNASVNFTATLNGTFTPTTPTTGSTTTSTVAFYADASSTPISGCATVALAVNAGVYTATCGTNSLDITTHHISATYSGDPNFATSSTTSSATYIPTQASTTMTIAAPGASAVNTSATFTATLHGTLTPVTPTTGSTTTSTVAFYADGNATPITGCATNALAGNAGVYTATCSTNSLDGTTHSISATYSGDTNFAGSSTTAPVSYKPSKASTSVTVTASVATAALNTNVTFTATLSGTFTPVTPGSTVGFFAGGSAISNCGTQSISASGSNYVATCTTDALDGGTNVSIVATYNGDTNFNGSTSSGLPHTTTPLSGSLTVTSSAAAGTTAGSSVTYTATVTASSVSPVAPSGNVAFALNTVPIPGCTSKGVNASQQATCTTNELVAPTDSITASYSGDTSFTPVTSGQFVQNVSKATPTVNLSAAPGTAEVNQTVTFTAIVPSPAGGSPTVYPTGSVTFAQNGTPMCGPVALSGAYPLSATCQHAFSSVVASPGVSMSATYSGDSNFTQGNAGNASVIVNTTPVTVTLTSSGTNFINQPVTFSVSLNPDFTGTATPGGTVTISTTAATLGTDSCASTLNVAANGTVPSCSYTFTAASSAAGYTVTATYHPSGTDFAPKTPNTSISQVIDAGSSGITLSTSLSQSAVNQPVTFTAAFNPPVSGSTKPKGQVIYTDGAAAIPGCTFNINLDGSIPVCNYAFTSAGPHSVTAPFTTADTNFNSANSNTISQSVNKASTSTALVSSVPQSSVNQTVTFTASVTPQPTGSQIPSGSIGFSYNLNGTTTQICQTASSAQLHAGTTSGTADASCTLPFSGSGSYTVTATYAGDPNFAAATPIAITQTVSNTKPGVTITPPASAVVNQQTTFSVELVAAFAGTVYPTGTVNFVDATDPKTILCAAPTLAADTVNQGNSQASCNATFVSGGTHSITASYAGDGNFPANSASVPLSVTPARSSLLLGPAAPLIFANQNVVFTAQISPPTPNPSLATPNGTVTFTAVGSGTALCSAVQTTPVGDGTATATCSVGYPHTPGLAGQYTVSASFSSDASFSFSNSSTGTTPATGASTVTVQDFNAAYTVTPKVQVGGTTILPLTNAVYLTTGSTTGNDIFGLVDIRAAISTSAPYNPNMKVSCAVTPVNPLNTAANPVYPPSCTPTPDTVAVAANAGGSTITLSTNLTGAGSSSATPGEYQFTLTVSDPNNPAGAQPSQAFSLFVIAPSNTFSMGSGASATQNVLFDTAGVPLGAVLTDIQCPFAYGPNQNDNNKVEVFSTTGLVTCSSSATGLTVAGVSTPAPVKIDTSGITTAQLMTGHSGMMYAATLFSVPFLAILGWLLSGKFSRRNVLRFLMGVVLILGLSWGISGCGGSFKVISTIPTPQGLKAGTYTVLVSGKVTQGTTTTQVYAVVPLDVIQN